MAELAIIDADYRIEDETNDSVGEKRDDEANNGVKNGVFSISNFFAVTTGKDVAKAAVDEHNNRNKTNYE